MLKKKELNHDHYSLIEKAAGLGLTQDNIAYLIGANPHTFRIWLENDIEVNLFYRKGKAKAVMSVSEKLMDKINNGDTTSIIFYLKCQAGWKDKDNVADLIVKPVVYLPEKDG